MSEDTGSRLAAGSPQLSRGQGQPPAKPESPSREPRTASSALLSVTHLTTGFDQDGRFVPAVIDVSFGVAAGETLCLVGESGSGKSLTALSIMRLIQPPGRIASGQIVFKGRDSLTLPEREMQHVRGAEIGLIFQEPMTALNPVYTIGNQIEETLRIHGRATRANARQKAIELLDDRQRARAGKPRARLSASALGRTAPARAHRAGARLRAGAPHRRRAHHRPRRDHSGADPRPAARSAKTIRARAAAHHT